MAQFNLSDTVDSNKVFLIKRSELEGRIDTTYNLALKKSLIKSKYPLKTLLKIHKSVSGGTPSKDIIEYWNGSIPWVSPKDIKSFYLYESQDSITELGVKNSSTKVIEPNNLLIVFRALKEGEINCTINKNAVAINQDLKALYFDETLIIDYVLILFKVLEKNIFPLITKLGTTVYSINTVEFNKLKIPVPPKYIQQQIIDLYQTAYTLKQQKEAQATALLASIDTYLLNELGITLPEKDTSLQSRINTNVRLKDISGSRFDPMLYDKNTIALKEAIINVNEDKFITKPLKKFVIKSVAGDWGLDENDNIINEEFEKCLVIRATEFDNDYNLKLDNSRVKYRLIKKDKLEKINIQEDDLLIEKSGGSPDQPVGRISILTKDILVDKSICYSNFIHKIRVDSSKLNSYYLFCFLKTIHNIKLTEAMQSQTNGIRNLIMSTYLNQTIVLPIKSDGSFDLEKQTEIANHIQDIRTQAKQLQEEAKAVLEEAKIGVEKMILG